MIEKFFVLCIVGLLEQFKSYLCISGLLNAFMRVIHFMNTLHVCRGKITQLLRSIVTHEANASLNICTCNGTCFSGFFYEIEAKSVQTDVFAVIVRKYGFLPFWLSAFVFFYLWQL